MDRVKNLIRHDELCLVTTWFIKASYYGAQLMLDRLIIDATDAFLPTGEFLGLSFAKTRLKFQNGLPPHLEIIAPDKALADEMRALIVQRNN